MGMDLHHDEECATNAEPGTEMQGRYGGTYGPGDKAGGKVRLQTHTEIGDQLSVVGQDHVVFIPVPLSDGICDSNHLLGISPELALQATCSSQQVGRPQVLSAYGAVAERCQLWRGPSSVVSLSFLLCKSGL
jgi:hypothetical protein